MMEHMWPLLNYMWGVLWCQTTVCGATCSTAVFYGKLHVENITYSLKMEGGECLTMVKCHL